MLLQETDRALTVVDLQVRLVVIVLPVLFQVVEIALVAALVVAVEADVVDKCLFDCFLTLTI